MCLRRERRPRALGIGRGPSHPVLVLGSPWWQLAIRIAVTIVAGVVSDVFAVTTARVIGSSAVLEVGDTSRAVGAAGVTAGGFGHKREPEGL